MHAVPLFGPYIQLKPKSITTINKSMTMSLFLFVWKSTFIYLHNMWTTCILHQQLGQQWSPPSGAFGLKVNYEPMDLTIVCLKCLSTYCWAYLVDARAKEKCRGGESKLPQHGFPSRLCLLCFKIIKH